MDPVTLTLVNATSKTLYVGSTSVLRASSGSIGPGQLAVFSGTVLPMSSPGVVSLYFNSGRNGTPFEIRIALKQEGKTMRPFIYPSAPDNYVLGYHTNPAPGGLVNITATAYPGLTVDQAAHGYAIDLTSKPMHYADTYPYVFADFINAMFDPRVRSAAVVAAAGKGVTNHWDADDAPPAFYADFTGGQFSRIVGLFKDYWLNNGPAACPGADQVLINTLRTFIQKQKPSLWLPVLSVHADGPPQVFNLKGYVRLGFYKSGGDWSESTVERFLTLIASGAHIVQICARQDMEAIHKSYTAAADFFDYFVKEPIVRGNDLGSSHYVDGGWNNAGWYYLNIDGELMPGQVVATPDGPTMPTGLLDAFMVSATVIDGDGGVTLGDYNTFLQSEGWQQQGLTGGDRHMDDLGTANATVWNIGTLGASPYSEKRGTTVFLAPDGWTPKVTDTTLMMPYVGAYAKKDGKDYKPQPWLKTALVKAVDPVDLDKDLYVVS
ncbi:hypothetical protein QO010_004115 [Caulobacter ginsengisoli]|uniref:Uncharacterized protein n=1 Tax=Caulobacter ginsengisoli TaxID=400775 RepID=A0ABU0IZC8_9CAUL|nr:hypothetical protein [Caulobacter ginsengisoli]MDQ0466322.1 hypothetical protein [Caulobacter ginsengisoli]